MRVEMAEPGEVCPVAIAVVNPAVGRIDSAASLASAAAHLQYWLPSVAIASHFAPAALSNSQYRKVRGLMQNLQCSCCEGAGSH